MRGRLAVLGLALLLVLAGCGAAEDGGGAGGAGESGAGGAGGAGAGNGTDPALTARCLAGCHEPIAAGLANLPSHGLLYDCSGCHVAAALDPGPGHQTSAACGGCHSARSHPPSSRCAFCHDPHGTPNLWSLREELRTPAGALVAVSVKEAAGATPEGLVHRGVAGAAGPGLCEACHRETGHYRADGGGTEHDGGYCGACHPHDSGFLP